ncbi:MAG TPA: SH3 domain-containing protein, partial [Thermomicrobiales bacterium]|nr:SH3 domain-containing protein [Thermomicrobiales bacterium]
LGATATVRDGPLNLRQAAGRAAPVLATLQAGATVIVIDGPAEVAGEVWYQVATSDGTRGWCAGAYLGAN